MAQPSPNSIHLNGAPAPLAAGDTVASLVARLGFGGKRIAVELNGANLPRSEHAKRVLVDGDRLEIVHAVGGG